MDWQFCTRLAVGCIFAGIWMESWSLPIALYLIILAICDQG